MDTHPFAWLAMLSRVLGSASCCPTPPMVVDWCMPLSKTRNGPAHGRKKSRASSTSFAPRSRPRWPRYSKRSRRSSGRCRCGPGRRRSLRCRVNVRRRRPQAGRGLFDHRFGRRSSGDAARRFGVSEPGPPREVSATGCSAASRTMTGAAAARSASADCGHNGGLTPTTSKGGQHDGKRRRRVWCLGTLQLIARGGDLVQLGAPKQRAVLAMLVVNRNRAVSVDSLIDAVWDQQPVPAARTSIHSYVSNLRRLIGTAGFDPSNVLASVSPGYQLNVADADCDLGRFIAEKNAGVHAAAAGTVRRRQHLSVGCPGPMARAVSR